MIMLVKILITTATIVTRTTMIEDFPAYDEILTIDPI